MYSSIYYKEECEIIYEQNSSLAINLCFDCTRSIPQNKFDTLKKSVIDFCFKLHTKNLLRNDSLNCDQVGLTQINDVDSGFTVFYEDMYYDFCLNTICRNISVLNPLSRRTALYDTLERAINSLIENFNSKPTYEQLLICITDGNDNNSRICFEDVRDLLYKSNCKLILICIGRKFDNRIDKLKDIAEAIYYLNNHNDLLNSLTLSIYNLISYKYEVIKVNKEFSIPVTKQYTVPKIFFKICTTEEDVNYYTEIFNEAKEFFDEYDITDEYKRDQFNNIAYVKWKKLFENDSANEDFKEEFDSFLFFNAGTKFYDFKYEDNSNDIFIAFCDYKHENYLRKYFSSMIKKV